MLVALVQAEISDTGTRKTRWIFPKLDQGISIIPFAAGRAGFAMSGSHAHFERKKRVRERYTGRLQSRQRLTVQPVSLVTAVAVVAMIFHLMGLGLAQRFALKAGLPQREGLIASYVVRHRHAGSSHHARHSEYALTNGRQIFVCVTALIFTIPLLACKLGGGNIMASVWNFTAVALLVAAILSGTALESRAREKSRQTTAEFFIKSNNDAIELARQKLDTGKASDEHEKRLRASIKKLEATNAQLRKLNMKPESLKTAEAIRAYIKSVVETQDQAREAGQEAITYSSYPTQITFPTKPPIDIGDLTPILPPFNPTNPGDCKSSGDAVKNDCLIGAQMMEECGAISMGTKTAMQFSCGMAGQMEEMKCNSDVAAGIPHTPPEPSEALNAEAVCRAMEERGGNGQPLETQTSSGN
ncbi:hypothetical protein [Parvularcula sp. LCG005]|uniref:hypothetical protein n=1 Tax=Parvularcula sp. LCG005 TaxID=3078805 RepID=UPI0029433790|nr:hypothetical protein [Parvularcula sp. LCG005]WOI53577.1 hypothetical protein RUI03_00950 [Parvularcula sp. LCG005]